MITEDSLGGDDQLPPAVLLLVEDLLWNRDPEGTEKLLAYTHR